MENNVTVIGFKDSGKTTYLAGMYMMMSAGRKNFSLVAKDPDMDLILDRLWSGICEGRFPLPSDNDEKFTFHIAHNYKPVCDFDWLDYPGGILVEPSHPARASLNESIANADCLVLVLDGKLFQIDDAVDEEDYEERLTKRLEFDRGLRSETKALSRLSAEGVEIPPVCLMVTKCDLIDLRYQAVVEKVLRNSESMKGIFEGNKLVMTASVSLGADISTGGTPNPFCIEQPIAFAVLTILIKYLTALKIVKDQNRDFFTKPRGFISSLFNAEKIEKAEKNIKELEGVFNKLSQDAYSLIDLFSEKKKIFVYGKNEGFRDYFRDIFRELGE